MAKLTHSSEVRLDQDMKTNTINDKRRKKNKLTGLHQGGTDRYSPQGDAMRATPRLGNRSNCLVFAVGKWFSNSGYLLIRKSHFGWWPHFLWSPDINRSYVEHYAPVVGKRKLVPPPLFKGKIQTFDKTHTKSVPNDIYAKIESVLFVLFCCLTAAFGIVGAFVALAVVVPIYRLLQTLARNGRAKARKNQRATAEPSTHATRRARPSYIQRASGQFGVRRSSPQEKCPIPQDQHGEQQYWVLH